MAPTDEEISSARRAVGGVVVSRSRPQVVDTNFYGVVHVTREALPIMRQQWRGTILQISSVGGRIYAGGELPQLAP